MLLVPHHGHLHDPGTSCSGHPWPGNKELLNAQAVRNIGVVIVGLPGMPGDVARLDMYSCTL